MSTSQPIEERTGYYYPVMRQGSGVASISAAIDANAYIITDESATILPSSAKDGKVKAELGEIDGSIFEYTFTIHNFSGEETEYTLETVLFTQNLGVIVIPQLSDVMILHSATFNLEADDTYSGDTVEGNTVTVAFDKLRLNEDEVISLIENEKLCNGVYLSTTLTIYEFEYDENAGDDTPSAPGEDNGNDDTTSGDNGADTDNDSDNNVNTGVVLAMIPAMVSGAALAIFRKRKR